MKRWLSLAVAVALCVLPAFVEAQSVNTVIPVPAAAGANPSISATGPDTDIGITLTPKGAGAVNFFGAGTATTVGPYATPGPRSGTSSNIIKKLLLQSLSIVGSSGTGATGALCAACSGYFSNTVIVPGLAVTDAVFIDSGNISANTPCKPVQARVNAANSLTIWFAKVTLVACTPSPGIFHILVVGT